MAKKKNYSIMSGDPIVEEGFFQNLEMKGDQMYIDGKPVPKKKGKDKDVKEAMGVKDKK